MPLNIIQQGNALSSAPQGFRWSYNQYGQAVLVPSDAISDVDPNSMQPAMGYTGQKPTYDPNMLMAAPPQQLGVYRSQPATNPDPRSIDPRYIFTPPNGWDTRT